MPATDRDGDARDRDAALDAAARLLAQRPRTRTDLGSRLRGRGFDPEATEGALDRLEELGIVDDADFARRWIEERSRTRGLAGEALAAELVRKGVATEVARAALEAAAPDEAAGARAVARRHLARVARLPLRTQAARLQAAVLRRGYPLEVAEEAVREVLPPEGWD
jgi:regulatory protein